MMEAVEMSYELVEQAIEKVCGVEIFLWTSSIEASVLPFI